MCKCLVFSRSLIVKFSYSLVEWSLLKFSPSMSDSGTLDFPIHHGLMCLICSLATYDKFSYILEMHIARQSEAEP